jgi:hypothetical protein
MLVIPLTYGKFGDFGGVQAGVAFFLILVCGLLSLRWGNQFVETVTRMLDGTGL